MSAKSETLKLKYELESPDEALQKKAFTEIRETPQNIEKGLRELKTLLNAEKDLVVPTSDDVWLLAFLRLCKFYPESARDRIKYLFTVRHKYPEIKSSLLPSKMRHVFETNTVTIFPKRDQHGRRILIMQGGKQWNYKIVTQADILSATTLCTDWLCREPATQINGIVYILDLGGLTLDRAFKFTPFVIKRILDSIQDGSPLRIKGFHIVKEARIFTPIFAASSPFFTEKFRKRILLHGNNLESLHRHIDPECLPKCFGGLLEDELACNQETYQLLSQYENKFQEMQKYGLI